MKLRPLLTWWFATVSGDLCDRIWSDNQSTLNGVGKISHCTDSGRRRSYKNQDIRYSTVNHIYHEVHKLEQNVTPGFMQY